MGIVVRVLAWLWRFLTFFSPIAGALFAVGIYSGLAISVYSLVDATVGYISSYHLIFSRWADGLSTSISDAFSYVSGNSFFQLFAYVTSFDVPIEWFRSCSDTFVRFWLTSALGIFVGFIEACIVVLGVIWIRKRLRLIAMGLSSSGGIGGGVGV